MTLLEGWDLLAAAVPPMNCLDEHRVLAFLDGSLSPADSEQVRGHIDDCPHCRELLAAVARVDPTCNTPPDAQGRSPKPPQDASPFAPLLARGTLVGRYLLLDRLGSGGMGVVYSAYDPTLERKVAVKLVRDDAIDPALRDEVRARLLREGKAVAKLSHPNVVAVHDMGTYGEQVFIAMEMVDGGTLRTWLLEKPRTQGEILALLLQAGAGLSAAHRAGLVHRDFKPDNVLLGRDGRVRVTDFGLARTVRPSSPPPLSSLEPSGAPETRLGMVVGTPAYMPPEQLRADPTDHRSDQFSFCVTLWEALYQSRPFTGPPGVGEPTPPKQSRVPVWLRRVLVRGLSPLPADRYPSMDALLAALAADPRAVLRRRLGWAAVAAAVALGVTLVALFPNRTAQLCGGSQKLADELWSPARQTLIRDAFVATGYADAEQTFPLVQRGVDDYLKRWVAMRTEACEATRVLGAQSDEMLGRRMLCLDRSRGGVRALLDVLSRPDPEIVGKAAEAVQALPSLRACADVEVLSAQVAPPGDPALAARVEALRARLDEARSLFFAGKVPASRQRLDEAVREAEGLSYAPARAETLELLGRIQEQQGELRPAEETLIDALVRAEASRHDRVGAQAAMLLVRVVGARQSRFPEARTWGRLSEGLIQRSGGDEELRAELDVIWGLLLQAENKDPEAVERYRRALASLEKTAPQSLRLAEALNHLASALRTVGNQPEALAAYQRALALRERLAGADTDLAATSRNGLGNLLMALGRFQEALEVYRRVLATFERRVGPTHFRTASALNNIGVALAEQGRFEEALASFERALQAKISTLGATNPKVASAQCDVAAVELELGRTAAARARLEQAQKSLEPLAADDPSRAECDLAGAQLLLATRQPRAAVPGLERVLAAATGKKGFHVDYNQAQARFLLARALWEAGPLDERRRAQELVRQARTDLAALGEERFRRDLAKVDALIARMDAAPAPAIGPGAR